MPPDRRRSGPDLAVRTAANESPPKDRMARITAGARRCPLQAAADRIGEPQVTAAVARYHPASCCPARRRSTP
jgi:hypothetical protein